MSPSLNELESLLPVIENFNILQDGRSILYTVLFVYIIMILFLLIRFFLKYRMFTSFYKKIFIPNLA